MFGEFIKSLIYLLNYINIPSKTFSPAFVCPRKLRKKKEKKKKKGQEDSFN